MKIGEGNIKLGKNILTFSLPALKTCIGSTELCRSICYANKGYLRNWKVESSYQRNYEESLRDDFVDLVVNAIREKLKKRDFQYFRIHVSGDFYSQEYLEKWKAIIKEFPNMNFSTWTKSWMLDFSDLPKNLTCLYSVMADTKHFSPHIKRLCFLGEEIVPEEIRKEAYVCPYKNIGRWACEVCKRCYGFNPPQFLILHKH
jgi:hypothetical protein